VQSAWAIARCEDCFLTALFFRIAKRRGLKKAAVAVAHPHTHHRLAHPG
jgi:hypothetical protein